GGAHLRIKCSSCPFLSLLGGVQPRDHSVPSMHVPISPKPPRAHALAESPRTSGGPSACAYDESKLHASYSNGAACVLQEPHRPTLWHDWDETPLLWTST